MSRIARPARLLAIGSVVWAAACVTPAPTDAVYEAKAALTAQDAASSAQTAVLATSTRERGRLTAAALEVLLQESESALGSVQSTFDSVQPPRTATADALRDKLDSTLSDAVDAARELRIAARRGDQQAVKSSASSLSDAADDLATFAQEHQG